MKDKLHEIILNYGYKNQLKKLSEEIYELQEAVLLYDGTQISLEHIIEEMADTMVLFKQIQIYYDISTEEIKKIMEYKINRQIARIEEINY